MNLDEEVIDLYKDGWSIPLISKVVGKDRVIIEQIIDDMKNRELKTKVIKTARHIKTGITGAFEFDVENDEYCIYADGFYIGGYVSDFEPITWVYI